MVRKVLIFIFTLIMFCLSTLVLYIQVNGVEDGVNAKVDSNLKVIAGDLRVHKKIRKKTFAELEPNLYFAIWRQLDSHEWKVEVLNTAEVKLLSNPESPTAIPGNIKGRTRIYEAKNIGGSNYTVWINRNNIKYIVEFIMIPFFLLILIYITILMFIIVFFNPSRELVVYDHEVPSYAEEEDGDTQERSRDILDDKQTVEPEETQKPPVPQPPAAVHDTAEPAPEETDEVMFTSGDDQEAVLEEYRKLWGQSFKISDTFKKSFPFNEIYELIRFRTEPEEYLKNSIIIASEFFMWTNPALFIRQEDNYINIETKAALNEESISIPTSGNRIGPVYLPVFAGEAEEPLGYFYFEWHSTGNFSIADIIFVLKQIFSPYARSLFVNQGRNKKKLEEIGRFFEQDNTIFIIFLQVDSKEKLMLKVSDRIYEALNDMIYENLFKNFKDFNVFEIVPYYYGIYGNTRDYEKIIQDMTMFCGNDELHNYEISKQYGNIAVSLSGGGAKISKRITDVPKVITAAEENLSRSIKQGGDQITFD